MKTLFVTMMAYPPIGGELLRNWQNISIMSNFGQVAVFSVFKRENDYQGENKNIAAWHHYNVADQSSPKAKLELGWQWLQQSGLVYYTPYLSAAARELDELLTEFKPDLVVMEQIWSYPYLKVVRRHNCKIVFDNHNVEAPLYKDTKASGSGLRAWVRKNLHIPRIAANEKEMTHYTDQVWLCSEDDDRIIQDLYGATSHSYVVPNGVDIAAYDSIRLQQCSFPDSLKPRQYNILYLGSYLYIPNIEAAHFLIEQVYPRIKKLFPDCRLLLAGRGPTSFMQEAAKKDPNIIITGEIPDVKPYLAAASLMLVPLFKGSGTRFKILEAFASGCPVISTTKGAEGIHANDGQHLLIADDADAMVEKIEQVWTDDRLGPDLAAAAHELVQAAYSWEAIGQQVKVAIEKLF